MAKPSLAEIDRRLHEVKKEIASKAGHDAAFRAKLLGDARGAIEEEYSLPKGALASMNIHVVEEGPSTIVIPIPPDMRNLELSDLQLEAVAGGFSMAGPGILMPLDPLRPILPGPAPLPITPGRRGW